MEETETFVLAFAALPNWPMLQFQKERRRKKVLGNAQTGGQIPVVSAACIYTTMMNVWWARKLLAGDRASSNPEQTSKGSAFILCPERKETHQTAARQRLLTLTMIRHSTNGIALLCLVFDPFLFSRMPSDPAAGLSPGGFSCIVL